MRTKISLLLSLFSIALIYSQNIQKPDFKPVYISLDWFLAGYNVGSDSFNYFDQGGERISAFYSTPDIEADIPISNITAFEPMLLVNIRTGYTTAFSTGIGVDGLLALIVPPYEKVAPYGFRVPLMFGITFPDKSSYSNGRRTSIPSGIRLRIGGYYGFNNSFTFSDDSDFGLEDLFPSSGLDDIEEERRIGIKNSIRDIKGTNFGGIFEISYIWGGFGFTLDVKSDITNFNEEVSGDYKRTIVSFGFSIPIIGQKL